MAGWWEAGLTDYTPAVAEFETYIDCPGCGEPVPFDGDGLAANILAGEVQHGDTFPMQCQSCGWQDTVRVETEFRPS
jgi:endogenous inhibitor of DNA gyrase (YacG/DUF329 family)